MSEKNTGGPAFPTENEHQTGNHTFHYAGMSMRDYGAFKVLQGFCANPAIFAANGMSGWGLVNCDEDQLTHYAYFIADAMLKARDA